mmetsp:Transcript_2189/g.7149  ORF Transcript_2189/g.7149 Transcript_2189/m.7149 type:complete len:244 (-) Transcript_2189:524-1255(-)
MHQPWPAVGAIGAVGAQFEVGPRPAVVALGVGGEDWILGARVQAHCDRWRRAWRRGRRGRQTGRERRQGWCGLGGRQHRRLVLARNRQRGLLAQPVTIVGDAGVHPGRTFIAAPHAVTDDSHQRLRCRGARPGGRGGTGLGVGSKEWPARVALARVLAGASGADHPVVCSKFGAVGVQIWDHWHNNLLRHVGRATTGLERSPPGGGERSPRRLQWRVRPGPVQLCNRGDTCYWSVQIQQGEIV